jgi:Calcineurin-like phosphoesterase superfamily domain
MLLGLVTDIHGAAEPLARALSAFRSLGVNRVVTLGDTCDMYSPAGRLSEVAILLRDAGAVGVWGNHDFGLCGEVGPSVRAKVPAEVLEFMAGMRPYLTFDDCRFSHVEPWLDPHRVEDLWYFDGPPETTELAARSFAAVPERTLFHGHFHKWLVMTPTDKKEWAGEGELDLSAEPRALVIVAPVFEGWAATFDTTKYVLSPIRCQP